MSQVESDSSVNPLKEQNVADRNVEPARRRFVVGVLAEAVAKSALYQPWLSQPPADIEVRTLANFSVDHPLPSDIDLLITHNHYRWDELAVLRQTMVANDRGVLVLADGILEFRNSWENPTIPSGSLLQPAMAHKIATIGPAQSRWLESWGNLGCCETVGLPRLDAAASAYGWHLSATPPASSRTARAARAGTAVAGEGPRDSGPPTLLICSARTPAFSEEQWAVTLSQFRALADYLQRFPPHDRGRPVDVRWRVAERLESELNLPTSARSTGPLAAELEQASAVITMPSTVQLEAMLYRLPVATLDFFHLPSYVPAAWQITAPEHFAEVIPQLFSPCPLRQFYQDNLLRDQLWCQTPASERMWALVAGMARIAGRQRQQGWPVRFPRHVLSPAESRGICPDLPPADPIDWAKLLPARTAWKQQAQAAKLEVWELTEVDAALVRSRQLSLERQLVQTYESNIAQMQNNINSLQSHASSLQQSLEELQERWGDAKRRLEQRNADLVETQEHVRQLAAEKLAAHEKLKEAYADAQRKQDRVNELRTQYQEIRTAYEALKHR